MEISLAIFFFFLNRIYHLEENNSQQTDGRTDINRTRSNMLWPERGGADFYLKNYLIT